MKRLKQFKPIILKILQVILIAFTLYMMVFTIISVRNFNNPSGKGLFGYKFFVVLSDSMKPEFQAGDVVIVKTIDPANLKAGDIITFYSSDPGSYIVTHQIEEKTEVNGKDAFITKGINVGQEDQYPVLASNVIGRYSLSIPKAGHLFQFLKTPLGYVFLVLIPFLLILAYNGTKFVKLYKQYQNDKQAEMDQQKKLLEEEKQKNEKMLEELRTLKAQIGQNVGNNG